MITAVQTAIDEVEQVRETLWGESRETGWGWSELDDATLDDARNRLTNAVSALSAWCSRECPAIDSAPLHRLARAVAAWDGWECRSWEDPRRGTPPWTDVKRASAEADVVLDKIRAALGSCWSAATSNVTLNQREEAVVQALRECGPLKGEDVAARAGYAFSGSFKELLSAMVRHRIIQHTDSSGYHLPESRY
jgi:hypothetical protein